MKCHSLSVSVIIPTYNRFLFLRDCLESVQAQTCKPDEIIVVDDGSDDDTKDLCERHFPEVQYCFQKNAGVSSARNTGIKRACGEWLAFLDSDDLWDAQKLEKQLATIKDNPAVRLLQTEEIWIRNGRRVNPRRLHRKPAGWIFEPSVERCLVSPSAVMIHRSVFERRGLFDESLAACEDYDFWLRAALHDPIHLVSDALTIKRGGHSDQLSKQWGLDRHRVQSLLKILFTETLDDRQKTLLRESVIKRCRILINGFEKRGKIEEALYYKKIINQMSTQYERSGSAYSLRESTVRSFANEDEITEASISTAMTSDA
jgi:glycosyltransferase involved in cell wall biosynthesis